jgi:hypothetical protein
MGAGRHVGLAAAAALLTAAALAAPGTDPPPAAAAGDRLHGRVATLGRSAEGRPIRVVRLGDRRARR